MENFFLTEYFDWPQARSSKRVELANRLLEKLGFWTRLQPPVYTGSMTNIEQRMNMYHLVSQPLAYHVPGDLVELGCNDGRSAVLIHKVMAHHDPSRKLHVYDSFEGLPKAHAHDGSDYFAGQMQTTRDKLLANFKRYDLPPPEIHAGWFSDTLPDQLPDRISFAHLDGDFYESILVSLKHVYPRMPPGAICLIDDYSDPDVHVGWNKLPGVKRACDEFLADKPEEVSLIYAGDFTHGFFRKQ